MTWADETTLIVGYRYGDVAVLKVEMNKKRIETVSSQRVFSQYLDGLSFSPKTKKVALAGDGAIRIIGADNWAEVTEEGIQLHLQIGRVAQVAWSTTGELLCFCTTTDAQDLSCSSSTFTVDFEPSFASCGRHHCAVGTGNFVKYFSYDSSKVALHVSAGTMDYMRAQGVHCKHPVSPSSQGVAANGTNVQVDDSRQASTAP
ncbi:conserved hypothetical protein [Neospora caninum Liverpool]|uniref:Uncharacterized protein n=1 Tax=Neospora caninum (strain Liverpool) TaxID=572307 RepID=F0VAK4_NEOCL|nr:conserved hypothetical protein [Neospora caninum Liverpool]CBZ50693.1 conserved hypothetical protein [Neospora caninum Liverpool]CEL65304.1 TPA: hypothetical protein BN1204_011600 [Neospora caninum Liverpool]|eukprot:XP_003880726.1 conserved hypothetical protein [Neospora caninum Liverpool]